MVMVGKQRSRDYLGHTTSVLGFFVLCVVCVCVCVGGWSIGIELVYIHIGGGLFSEMAS